MLRPILFQLDAEWSHWLAVSALKSACVVPGKQVLERTFQVKSEALRTSAFGLSFSNPFGLAAGFDKNARYVEGLETLGFGFLEVGTVTFHAQSGNPKPRIKRIPESQALWNHLGFNNEGAAAMAARLKSIRRTVPLGINIGKSKIAPLEKAAEDYLASFRLLYPYGDYFVLNVSSPNTPGLRDLQKEENLTELLGEIQRMNRELSKNLTIKPVLVKISPDESLETIDAMASTAMEAGVAGIVATNTTLQREGLNASLPQAGGISGAPLRKRSSEIVRHLYKGARGKLSIIGCGGIFSAEDAFEKIAAGASLVQVYTGLVYEGPELVKKINHGLINLLKEAGFKNIREAVGSGVK